MRVLFSLVFLSLSVWATPSYADEPSANCAEGGFTREFVCRPVPNANETKMVVSFVGIVEVCSDAKETLVLFHVPIINMFGGVPVEKTTRVGATVYEGSAEGVTLKLSRQMVSPSQPINARLEVTMSNQLLIRDFKCE